MGIRDGLSPTGGGPTLGGDPNPHDDNNKKHKKPNRETFTPQRDKLTGSRNRPNHYILKTLEDALLPQRDAVTNFNRRDKAFLPGVNGILRKPITTLTRNDIDIGALGQLLSADFLDPKAVGGIRIKSRPGGKTLGTYIFINDATPGLQLENDAAFFLGRYDLSKSTPFRYEDSSLLT